MAVELATGYVNIIPSGRGFGAALRREIGGQVDAAGDDAGQRFGSRLGAGIASAAKVATVGIVALGAAASGFGLKIAAGNETAQISFKTMLGSADKAGAFLVDLKRFAATTPFEFPELQTAAGSLISIGVSADKVIPIMTTLGNVTSGMGTGAEGVKRATVAIQQMNAAGRITAQDLNQLRDAGIPVFELLAGATGKTKEQLAGMAQNGKLGRQELEQLMKALETGKGLERFNGLMEKQSQSLSGIISTLKDTLGQGLADAVAPAIGPLKTSLVDLSEALGGELKTWGPVFATALGSLVELFGKLAKAALPVLGSLVSLFASVMHALGPIVERLGPPLGKLAQILADSLNGALDEVIPAVGDLLDALLPLLDPIGDLIKALAGPMARALATLMKAIVPLLRPLVRLATILIERIGIPVLVHLVEMIVGLAEGIAGMADSVGKLLDAGLATVVGWFERLLDNPAGALTELGDFFKRLPGLIKTAIGDLGAWLNNNVFAPAIKYLRDRLPGWIDDLAVFFKGLPDKVGTAIGVLGTWLWDNVFVPARDYITEHLQGWIDSVVGFFGQIPDHIRGAIEVDKALGVWLWDNVFAPARDYLVDKAPEWQSGLATLAADTGPALKAKIEETKKLGQYLWDEVFKPAIPKIQENAEPWCRAVAGFFARLPGDIVVAMTSLGDLGTRVWDEVLQPALMSLAKNLPIWIADFAGWGVNAANAVMEEWKKLPGQMAGVLVGLGLWLYNNFFVPEMNYLLDKLPDLFRSIGRLADHIIEGMGQVLGTLAGSVWDNWIKPALDQMTRDFLHGIALLWNEVVDGLNKVVKAWNTLPGFPGKQDLPELPRMEGFAAGGTPPVGRASLVGEAGPELFVPRSAGRIIPHDQLTAAGGLNIGSVNVTGQERPAETAFAIRSELRWLALTAGAA